ncbi:hypothetical protein Salat_1138800 [Sesamum alatum]|uniref:Uncharacterized protein n=1 Tax=Sesamum alatum TaxID=300844 RepID=A0AAE1YE14_9LAMI|nr:hypothetical protein Salat_1138800 [Sesamum alatum]
MATKEDDYSNFHISVNAMIGVHNFNTMRVTGCCKGKAINILIDTESTHNFVDYQVARRLGCFEATDPFPMVVANGSRVYKIRANIYAQCGAVTERRGGGFHVVFTIRTNNRRATKKDEIENLVQEMLDSLGFPTLVLEDEDVFTGREIATIQQN